MWTVENVLTSNTDSFTKPYGRIQFVNVNALTGSIINFYPDAIYGPIH